MSTDWCHKICIYSVNFFNLQGLQYYFPENDICNLKFYESKNFSDSSLHRIFDSKNFMFTFSAKSSLT